MTLTITNDTTTNNTAAQGEPVPTASNSTIAHGLCLVRTVIKSPDYRATMTDCTIESRTENGNVSQVDPSKINKSKWIWNTHTIFDQLTKNGRAIKQILNKYSIPDPLSTEADLQGAKGGGGYRIMPISSYIAFDEERNIALQERESLLDKMESIWWSEIIPSLKEYFGDYFYQLRSSRSLPSGPGDIKHRYAVICPPPLPLTPLSEDQYDLSALTPQERDQFVRTHQERVNQLFEDRFQAVFDQVLGQLHETCLEITHGPLNPQTGERTGSTFATGRKRNSSIQAIIDILDKAVAFKNVTKLDSGIITELQNAKTMLENTSYKDININKGDNTTVKAIQIAMGNLGSMVKNAMDNSPRNGKRVLDI